MARPLDRAGQSALERSRADSWTCQTVHYQECTRRNADSRFRPLSGSIDRTPGCEVLGAGIRVGVEGRLAFGHVADPDPLFEDFLAGLLAIVHRPRAHVLPGHERLVYHLYTIRNSLGRTLTDRADTLFSGLLVFVQAHGFCEPAICPVLPALPGNEIHAIPVLCLR